MEKEILLIVLWALLTLVSSDSPLEDSHVLRYFYTLTLDRSRKVHFVSVGILDGVQIDRYDSESQRDVPMVAWMNQDSLFWERETNARRDDQGRFSALMETFNHSHGGLQTFQAMCECGITNGRTWGGIRNAHNGQAFLTFDRQSVGWLAVAPSGDQAVAVRVKRLWERQVYWTSMVGQYVENICLERMYSFLQLGQAALKRKESPEVFVLAKTNGDVECVATAYLPLGARVQWVWVSQEEPEPELVLEGTDEVPNGDGTFQNRLTLRRADREKNKTRKMMEELGDGEYKCYVTHSSSGSPVVMELEKPHGHPMKLSLVVTAGVLLVVIGVVVCSLVKRRSSSRHHRELQRQEEAQETRL